MTIRAARTVGKDRRSVQINGGRKVTRREAREHCFKMLFCQDFYPAEEKEEQLERYFEAPKEDVTGEDGKDEILHDPFEKEEDHEESHLFRPHRSRPPSALQNISLTALPSHLPGKNPGRTAF